MKSKTPNSFVLALFLTALMTVVIADAEERPKHTVTVASGIEPTPVSQLDYAYVSRLLDRTVRWHAEITLPLFRLDGMNHRERLSGSTMWLERELDVEARASIWHHAGESVYARHSAFGFDVWLRPGWYPRGGSVALELGWQHTIASRLAHSAAYREVYAGARNGWYGGAGGRVSVGLAGSLKIADFRVGARAGMRRTEALSPTLLFPFYAMLSVGYSF